MHDISNALIAIKSEIANKQSNSVHVYGIKKKVRK